MRKLALAGGSLVLSLLAGPARAGTITAVGAVSPLFSTGQLVSVVGHGNFDEGPTSGNIPLNVYASQGLKWVSGPLAAALPGVTNTGNAAQPEYDIMFAYFPSPIAGGGTTNGVHSMLCGVATFSVVVTQVGLTATTNGTQYLMAWDKGGKKLGQVTWTPANDAAFVGIDTLGVPIGMIAYGNDDLWNDQPYDIGGLTIFSDSWIWATGAGAKQCTSSAQCDDGNPCTDDACNAQGLCAHTSNTAPCDDKNACTSPDVCSGGVCKGLGAKVCVATDGCHVAGACNPTSGACTNPAKPNGSACSDANACTQTDTCNNGVCSGANPVTCPPAGQCYTGGICDKTTGMCTGTPASDGTPCDDGDACSQYDACLGGKCIGSDPVLCPGTDPCHDVGMCSPVTGQCAGSGPAPDGTPCPGGTCASGVCTPPQPGTGGSHTGGSGTGGSIELTGRAGCDVTGGPSGAVPGTGLLLLLALGRRRARRERGR